MVPVRTPLAGGVPRRQRPVGGAGGDGGQRVVLLPARGFEGARGKKEIPTDGYLQV